MKFKASYIRLLTEKFDEMAKFYKDIIGLPVLHENPDMSYTEFDAGPIKLSIFKSKLMAEALGMEHMKCIHECQDKNLIVLETKDVDATAKMLRDKGIFLLSEPTDRKEWDIRTVHTRDPDGNMIEFNQRLD